MFFFSDTSESSVSCPVTPKKRQGSIESAFADKFDQEKALNLFYNFFTSVTSSPPTSPTQRTSGSS
jgi:hypothetical protein